MSATDNPTTEQAKRAIDLNAMPEKTINYWLPKLKGKLIADKAKDLSDAELHRVLDDCSSTQCYPIAIFFRDNGYLTLDDLSTEQNKTVATNPATVYTAFSIAEFNVFMAAKRMIPSVQRI